MDREEEDIFTDDFKKLDEKLYDLKKNIGSEKKEEYHELEKPKKSSNISRKKAGIIGLVIILTIATGLGLWLSGIVVINNISSLFQEKFESISKQNPTEIITDEPETKPEGEVPFKGVASATDKVEVQKTNEVLGYFLVTSDDDWYGDFVDFREIPSKLEKSGSQQINFRCYTDDFQGTSTYFGTFRNVLKPNLSVDVFISGVKVQTQSTDTNKALILEGDCYGN